MSPRRLRTPHARTYTPGFFIKVALMALVNALGVYVVIQAWGAESWGVLAFMVAALVVADYVYFSRRTVPMKYILPGLFFLLAYQIFTVAYTGYVAFTNYGEGHNSTKEHAIEALLVQNEQRVEGSSSYPLTVVERDGELGFAILDDGVVRVGTATEPLREVGDAVVEDERITRVPGFEVLDRQAVLGRQAEVVGLRVPVSDDAEQGSVRTQDARSGYVYRSVLEYDEDADTMTDRDTGVVYRPNDQGQFEAPDGSTLNVGWRVPVGFDNFTTAFADSRYAEPFLKVLVWTFAFAILSVGLTFFLGLFLAIVLNDERVRGRKLLRALLILPYAFPPFMSFLLWRGLLNTDFGFINEVLLGGAGVPWLTNEWLARAAVLGVQLWVGFPYMFLITTGALQSIPGDVVEAAKIDGAGRFRIWRSITLPLLLIAVAPLLISSFAFNFNNFNAIEMITEGGPRFADTSAPVGATDILITMVYSISGLDGRAATNYGLASALSLVIFLIVATISVITFRRTQALEDIN
ncbi:ABC transporter permease subunit [uncultured Georgenia sp.]|uniref:ABC transporter permease subunit n=1 Tax=uncultured Georgenia sp. TaxID=378209 RepID=UPI0026126772|nr:ABC transporter permease subunit [uncultured Georgenia sp.]